MTESIVAVTEGSGKNYRTFQRSIGGNTVEEQYINYGDPGVATYSAVAADVSTSTTSSHLFQVAAGSSYNVRLHEIRIAQRANASTSAGIASIQLLRLTSAGSGGTAITFRPHDLTDDPAPGVTGMTLPSSKGTEGVILDTFEVPLHTAVPSTTQPQIVWTPPVGTKPYIIPAGASNGFAFKLGTGVTGASLTIKVIVTQTLYL